MNKKPGTNEFYDINRFPTTPGMTVLGISMPLITTKQKPSVCFKQTKQFISKIKKPVVGAIISYTDGLYLNDSTKASELKRKHAKLVEEHKKGYQRLIGAERDIIDSAFSFVTWNQLLLDCDNFMKYFEQLKLLHKQDKYFQSIVKKDIKSVGKKVNKNTINYILEEVLLDYLIVKGKVRLRNDFVNDHEKWILNCYPGKPHRAHAFVHQSNFLKLKSDNCYQDHFYDLKNKQLIDFKRLDIETFNFS